MLKTILSHPAWTEISCIVGVLALLWVIYSDNEREESSPVIISSQSINQSILVVYGSQKYLLIVELVMLLRKILHYIKSVLRFGILTLDLILKHTV